MTQYRKMFGVVFNEAYNSITQYSGGRLSFFFCFNTAGDFSKLTVETTKLHYRNEFESTFLPQP